MRKFVIEIKGNRLLATGLTRAELAKVKRLKKKGGATAEATINKIVSVASQRQINLAERHLRKAGGESTSRRAVRTGA